MAEEPAGIQYETVDDAYFEKRGLKRYARVWSLWALGVGAVISGDFFAWSFGLAEGGFGGLLVATTVITAMYLGLCYSIAEMSPALPHTGGAYSFARSPSAPGDPTPPLMRVIGRRRVLDHPAVFGLRQIVVSLLALGAVWLAAPHTASA